MNKNPKVQNQTRVFALLRACLHRNLTGVSIAEVFLYVPGCIQGVYTVTYSLSGKENKHISQKTS